MADSGSLATQANRYFTLASGESIVFACRPAKLPRFALYLITLGLYEFWRRANLYAVTDRRVTERAGRITGTEASLPLFYVQDATIRTFLGHGYVYVSTAGGEGGDMSTRWLPRANAETFRTEILERAHVARGLSPTPPS
jgi:membrane protein YdbS with pleckstrin-like domain